jgi:hypothetical protein
MGCAGVAGARDPGYPAFLAVTFAFGGGLRTVVYLQQAAWAVLMLALAATAQAATRNAGGLVPIILVAAYPGLLLFRNVLTADLLFAVFLNLAMAGLLVATFVGKATQCYAVAAQGIGIAFDDFGTGYASLSYLTRYPLTRIKIDRSFIQQIGAQSGPDDTAIVRSIIVMGRNLGLEVIAEGVETAAQANFLKAEGCHELRGYLFSKPLPAEAFEQVLQSRCRRTRSECKTADA